MDFLLVVIIIFLAILAIFGLFIVIGLVRTKVPFIPSGNAVVAEILQVLELKNGQKFYELGCGNGKMLFLLKKKADQQGLKNLELMGYELVLPLVWWGNFRKRFLPATTNKIKIFSRDFFQEDLTDADFIFSYLFPPIMERISREIWPNLKKGTVLVSHAFALAEVPPTKVLNKAGTKIYVYVKNS